MIFVFGSNLAGRHGRGAALEARKKHGAIYGQGEGRQGNRYAIPTKDADLLPMSLDDIYNAVARFLVCARLNPELQFNVTRIGCGLAGYTEADIRPMFSGAPSNCHFNWIDE
jgi:hypothetical protein